MFNLFWYAASELCCLMCILSYHQYKYKSSNGLINIDKKQTFTFMTNAGINKNRNCFSRSYPPHFHTHRHPFRIYLNNVFVESSRHRLITKYYFNTREKERERDITCSAYIFIYNLRRRTHKLFELVSGT